MEINIIERLIKEHMKKILPIELLFNTHPCDKLQLRLNLNNLMRLYCIRCQKFNEQKFKTELQLFSFMSQKISIAVNSNGYNTIPGTVHIFSPFLTIITKFRLP
jgi:phage FluMu protein Com